MKTRELLLIILALLSVAGIQAQQTLLSASAGVTDAGGTVEYSVGQLTYHLLASDKGSLMEGVQQPWEYQVMPGFVEVPGIGLKCSVYPNPATSFITLEVRGREPAGLVCLISGIQGIPLKNITLRQSVTTIAVDDLPNSAFLLTLLENNVPLITYKLIKQ